MVLPGRLRYDVAREGGPEEPDPMMSGPDPNVFSLFPDGSRSGSLPPIGSLQAEIVDPPVGSVPGADDRHTRDRLEEFPHHGQVPATFDQHATNLP